MDYRNFSELGPVYINTTNFTWWEENKTNTPAAIFGALRTLKNSQSTLASMRALHARLYGNARMMGALGISGSLTTFSQKQRMSYNIIQSAIDTLTSKISKNRPKPLFLTSGGKAKMQRKAKKLTQFVDGVYFSNEAYKLMSRCFRDAGVFGTSAIHDFDNFGSVGLERVPIEELWVDEIESLYNPPRNLYRVNLII